MKLNSSRKFIDLIHAVSSKWANWDPPKQIKVGDYGTINKETGQFETEGNIYEDVTIANVATVHLPLQGAPENTFIVASFGVRQHELTLSPEIKVAGVVEASIKGKWEFGAKRGALLVMAQARTSYIPPNTLLKLLVDIPALRDKSLVTAAVSCPAYVMYLSSAEKESIDLALVGSAPVPGAHMVNVGSTVSMSWWFRNTTGLFREACHKEGQNCYTPLFTLKKIRKKGIFRRESPVPEPDDDDLWADTHQPWTPLDEDGEEIEFEDTVSD